ncbi:hypothetical protein EDB85DRAFT_1897890 [Lactarius pseudohatsudake]|nr:hypothetical protein EDB85DRAFT_1897890 [Lactarius pseudohatsudake]
MNESICTQDWAEHKLLGRRVLANDRSTWCPTLMTPQRKTGIANCYGLNQIKTCLREMNRFAPTDACGLPCVASLPLADSYAFAHGMLANKWNQTRLVRQEVNQKGNAPETLYNSPVLCSALLSVTVSPSPARDSPRDYMPTADIPVVESANTPEDPWWDWQAEEESHIQERVWAAIEALENTTRAGRLGFGVRAELQSSPRRV